MPKKTEKRKNLKFLIKSERPVLQSWIDDLTTQLEKYKEGAADCLVINNAVTVVIFDENNNYVTTL